MKKRVVLEQRGMGLYFHLALQVQDSDGQWRSVQGYHNYSTHADKLVDAVDFLLSQEVE